VDSLNLLECHLRRKRDHLLNLLKGRIDEVDLCLELIELFLKFELLLNGLTLLELTILGIVVFVLLVEVAEQTDKGYASESQQ
jgi:hypothetical protein